MRIEDKKFESQRALGPFMKRIFVYSLRYKKWLFGFLFWISIVAAVDAAFPLVVLNLIDKVLTPEFKAIKAATEAGLVHPFAWDKLLRYAGIFFGLGMLQVLGVREFIRYCGRMQEHLLYDLRDDMFRKLQRLSDRFYDRSAVGWLLSRLTSDTDRVTELISWGLIDLVWGIVMMFACLLAMFFYNWQIGLIVAAAIPILIVVSIRIRMLVLHYSRKARKLNSELTATFNEHINGVQLVKSTAQEERAVGEFRGLSGQMRKASFRAAWYTATYGPLVIFIGSMAAALVVYVGGSMALAVPAGITVGVLTASFEYATRIFLPIMDISRFYAMAQGSLSAGERIFSLLDEEVDLKDAADATDFDSLKGEVRFENLHFHYEADKPVLKGLDITVPAGQSVALVGPTGEGKSTIVKLIARHYDVVDGALKIDGSDIRSKTLHSLRSQMGVVLQSPHLFSGTILENVRFGRPAATDEEVAASLKLLGADDILERLAEEVGEGGEKLSEGERQIVSFARAVLANPRIFIMDEATSSVDTLTEEKIQKGLAKIIKGRTSFIIAHRLSTIRSCDRILMIGNGKIVEDGNHDELMASKGAYHHLYTRQHRGLVKRPA